MDAISSEDIVQFCAITSADPDVASNYLTVCDGSLDRAITLYMESGGIDLAATTSSTNTNRSRGERRSRSSSDEGSAGGFGSTLDQDEELARSLQQEDSNAASAIRAPIAPRHEMLLGDDYGNHSSSMFGGSSRTRAAPSVFLPPDSSSLARDAFRDFAAEAATLGGDTSPKTSRLADLFKAPLDMMARGDFDQSRNVAKNETKWLMVNIQEAGVFACQVLNRDLWSDRSVKEIVKENFVFLQFYSDSVEGKKYAAYYPLKTFPHIAIIDPRTGITFVHAGE
ncbi:UBX domain-containing protein 7 [Mortierella antarctica]|nr:UBX domain-containing protein 7 [Mortierella antarctica]